jgi:hypothetical protein
MKRLVILALVGSAASAAPIDMALFQQSDANGDGHVDVVEVMSSVDLQGRFNDIDTDRDGRLSAAEMQAWIDRPDKPHQFRDSAPLRADEQWREVQRRREAAEAQRAEDILAGKDEAADSGGVAPTDGPPVAPDAAASPATR